MSAKQFTVELYEPNVGPGGLQGAFVVQASDAREASRLAYQAAERCWPGQTHDLSVYSVTS